MEALLNMDTSIKLDIFGNPMKTYALLETATGKLIDDPVLAVVAAINEYILLFSGEFGADWDSKLSPTESGSICHTPPSTQMKLHLDPLGKTQPLRKEERRMVDKFPNH